MLSSKMKIFGERLLEILKRRGLTQAWLAKQLNVFAPNVNMWIKGATEPDLEKIKKIADLLNVPVDYLLGRLTFDQIDTYNAVFNKWMTLFEKVKAIANEKKYQVASAARGKLLLREAKDYILGQDTVMLAFENQIETEDWFNDYIRGNITEFDYWIKLCEWMEYWKQKLERDINK